MSKEEIEKSYIQLKQYLEKRDWKNANEETRCLMVRLGGDSPTNGYLASISNFPCADLIKIDQLWERYSNGKFGFTAQILTAENRKLSAGDYSREIITEDMDYYSGHIKIGQALDWYVNDRWLSSNELVYDLTKAQRGHLPFVPSFWVMGLLYTFFCRVKNCRFSGSSWY